MSSPLHAYSQEMLKNLREDARKHGLVLFVGSGVNGKAAPQWSGLLSGLLKLAIKVAEMEDDRIENHHDRLLKWCQRQFDPLAQATIAKGLLGPDRFRAEIQDAIYRQAGTEEELRDYCGNIEKRRANEASAKFEMLRVAGELCHLPEVRAVATFNFDTLLETAVESTGKAGSKKKIARSYAGPALMSGIHSGKDEHDVLPIYHVHGLLPHPDAVLRPDPSGLVMSYEDYFDKNADPLSWETSTMIHLLRNYCTLWIGVSLTDWNMLRLLDAAKGRRGFLPSYCVKALESIGGTDECQPPNLEEFQRVAIRFQAELFDLVGVKLITAGPKHDDVAKVLSTLLPLRRSKRPKL
jgi:hypothetical protein